jgi:hypothetical protein
MKYNYHNYIHYPPSCLLFKTRSGDWILTELGHFIRLLIDIILNFKFKKLRKSRYIIYDYSPIMSYGTETQLGTKRDVSQLQTSEMKFLQIINK